jgi:hypothetical protein
MVLIGLLDKIGDSVVLITAGRKGLATIGEAEAGLLSYLGGLSDAMSVFQEAAVSADVEAMILVEHAFLTEEKRFCGPANKAVVGSLMAASDSFDDAFRSLKAVADVSLYRGADLTYPRSRKYRVGNMPKDAFHIACIAHRTRLNNTLKTPGLNQTEQGIYKQRVANMGIAKKVYTELQQKALTRSKNK